MNSSYLLSKERGQPMVLTKLKEELPPTAYNQVQRTAESKAVIVLAANRKHAKLIARRLMKGE